VFEADIRAGAERVFDLLTDLRGYGRWLPRSATFRGTTEISVGLVAVGTTYVERSPVGVRRGVVTALEPPARFAFDQPMAMRPPGAGVIGIQVEIVLTPAAGIVHLRRVVQLSLTGPVRFAEPLVRRSIIAETQRTLKALKAFAEGQPK
jgi:uncharacterized protein YndB with AHSA1/START domain